MSKVQNILLLAFFEVILGHGRGKEILYVRRNQTETGKLLCVSGSLPLGGGTKDA